MAIVALFVAHRWLAAALVLLSHFVAGYRDPAEAPMPRTSA